ncbi:uncharacterized protein LAESUDRAFT_720386 [Laetiporus sulphureus 93-53]|uniref:C2 domain-containing protein n=1 Tax=Laetiporus sulphureus 93-53 TaxID=1314785 RepID=A0A165H3F9_9APHY|nr:uncharacterized protein LAESUDRAFT_720386 [Laetiporus sulphureus 93-53]KZT11191.1 hypothetical protein LAESUDRAFT_720386 [Laetiporus sulphureus 93-53]
MPGHKNPLQISSIIDRVQAAVTSRSKLEPPDPLAAATAESLAQGKPFEMDFVDLTVHFVSASGLPKMDVVGSADPYFVARLDNKISYISAVITSTRSPVWNEVWRVRNVPHNSTLTVEVMDKDSNSLTDDYIGHFLTAVTPGETEFRIEDRALKRNRGTFRLNIEIMPSRDPAASDFPYDFDGPVRYSTHYSPTVGRLTQADSRLYTTWKVYIKGVHRFFGDSVQHWNRDYAKARSIFQGPTALAIRTVIHTGHRMLYARTVSNGFGFIDGPEDVHHLFHGHAARDESGPSARNPFVHRIKPATYTYVIAVDDDSWRFSETGAKFLVNMASKHALHSNCAEAVRFSGEFHPRPKGGWENFQDEMRDEDVEWELVVDNKSGTYAPDCAMLPAVKALLEYNLPGFAVVTYDYMDPALQRSTDACRAYAMSKRGISPEDLSPDDHPEKETLLERASSFLHRGHVKDEADYEPEEMQGER